LTEHINMKIELTFDRPTNSPQTATSS